MHHQQPQVTKKHIWLRLNKNTQKVKATRSWSTIFMFYDRRIYRAFYLLNIIHYFSEAKTSPVLQKNTTNNEFYLMQQEEAKWTRIKRHNIVITFAISKSRSSISHWTYAPLGTLSGLIIFIDKWYGHDK